MRHASAWRPGCDSDWRKAIVTWVRIPPDVQADGKRAIWLRQRSRPYLFSNTLAPVITQTSIKVPDMLEVSTTCRDRLMENVAHFRTRMSEAGFDLLPGEHPIIPVMLRDPKLAQEMAALLDEKGVYVVPFSFPVVPRGQDRIRTQMSAAHSREELDRAIDAFIETGHQMEIIK